MNSPDGLSGYQERRLELADMIRAMLPVVRARGDARREQQVRGLLGRLASGRFRLAVIGQFSRGKTTLMNALLGHAYLPTGALPTTSVVTTVRYGTRPRALIRSRPGALPVEVPVSEVDRFVAQASADRARMRVRSVELEIPADLLRLGFEFIDTPGVGSAIAANTAAALQYLPEADAVVFVTGFDSALTSAETDFLSRAAGHAGGLFVVINKRDLVTRAEAGEITAYVERWASGNLPAAPPVFATSALQALGAALSNDVQEVAESGIGPLRDALTRFLTAERGRVALGNVAAAAAGLTARLERDLRAGQFAEGQPRDRILAEFELRAGELHDRLGSIANRIAATVQATCSDTLARRRSDLEAELVRLLGLRVAAEQAATAPEDDPLRAGHDALRLAGRQVAGDWLEQQTADLEEVLIAAAAADIGALLDAARSPRELGARAAGLEAFGSLTPGWAADEIPQLAVPVVDFTVPDPPARRRHHGRGSAPDTVSHLLARVTGSTVSDFVGRAAAAFDSAAADWARRLGEDAQRQASAEAAQFRRYVSDPPREGDLALLTDLEERLAGFRDCLASWIPAGAGPGASPDEEPPQPPVVTLGRCAVCEEMEAAQADYLFHRQFLLATSERAQAAHADTGGFCPLHTWQYAHVASPVGISAGNAQLARQLAGALREAAAASADPAELAERVAVIARSRACPACAALAEVEDGAARELAARASSGDRPPRLCLPHLARVLRACSSLAGGRAMTSAAAVALQAASQNMRAFALKREALRRGMITAYEDSAYADALRLLAGLPALAVAAQPD